MIQYRPSLMNIYNSGQSPWGFRPITPVPSANLGGTLTTMPVKPSLGDAAPQPIGLPDPTKGYGSTPPILGGGDVAPGGGFAHPRIIPPGYGKGYGLPGVGFGGGDVAPGGGFANPRLPYNSLMNLYRGGSFNLA